MNYFEKAERTAQWICRNQYIGSSDWIPMSYEDKEFDMNEDMNSGRFVRNYNMTENRITHLSSNWLSGMTIYGLLLLNDYSRKNEYMEASRKAAAYLKCLQNTMDVRPEANGAINERTSANRWCAPRDAVSAAWGLLRLYKGTGDIEYLNRTELFAGWHMNYAFDKYGYPFAYYFFDSQKRDGTQYQCQGGSALYYYDLYSLTGKKEYLDVMTRLVDYYITHFINDDGSLNIVYDPDSGGNGEDSGSEWCDMHKYNDDFGILAVLALYQVTRKQKYLDIPIKYMDWIVSGQNEDGSFGKFSLSVSSCIAALNLLNIYLITKNEKYFNAGFKAVKNLEKSVVDAPENLSIHGGILGMDVSAISSNNDILCLRVSMYAMYTFLLYGIFGKYIKTSDVSQVPDSIIDNPVFIGLKIYLLRETQERFSLGITWQQEFKQ